MERREGFEAPFVYIGPGAADRLVDYLRLRGRPSVRIVADANTWKAFGEAVEAAAQAAAIDTARTVFEDSALVADGRSVLRLLADEEEGRRLFLAVGSGTITDIVRFVAHRTGRQFLSLPTAPSVDAYASSVAPLVVDGIKRTMRARPPAAVFADIDVLSSAPRPMIRAGFGDMLCKFSAVADWRLGALLWNEGYDAGIAARSLAAAQTCAAAAEDIGAAGPAGVATLMKALVDSGLCMAEAGHSRPASGAEHHFSHFWEMRLLQEGRAPLLHGLKVGVGTLIAARLWDRVRALSQDEARRAFAAAQSPSGEEERRAIAAAFGPLAPEIEASQSRFLSLTPKGRAELVERALDNWEEIRAIARGVPDAKRTAALLEAAGCPLDPRRLGLGEAEIAQALASAHYLRDRFTVRKLALFLFGAGA